MALDRWVNTASALNLDGGKSEPAKPRERVASLACLVFLITYLLALMVKDLKGSPVNVFSRCVGGDYGFPACHQLSFCINMSKSLFLGMWLCRVWGIKLTSWAVRPWHMVLNRPVVMRSLCWADCEDKIMYLELIQNKKNLILYACE